jgi:hypothetical protein
MAIAETATKPASMSIKQAWVRHLANADLTKYPCFKSVTWFELDKGYDFRVVMNQSQETIDQTLCNFR